MMGSTVYCRKKGKRLTKCAAVPKDVKLVFRVGKRRTRRLQCDGA